MSNFDPLNVVNVVTGLIVDLETVIGMPVAIPVAFLLMIALVILLHRRISKTLMTRIAELEKHIENSHQTQLGMIDALLKDVEEKMGTLSDSVSVSKGRENLSTMPSIPVELPGGGFLTGTYTTEKGIIGRYHLPNPQRDEGFEERDVLVVPVAPKPLDEKPKTPTPASLTLIERLRKAKAKSDAPQPKPEKVDEKPPQKTIRATPEVK